METRSKFLAEHKCPVCGRTFRFSIPARQWSYKVDWKNQTLYACSWTCFRDLNVMLFNNPDGKVREYKVKKHGKG